MLAYVEALREKTALPDLTTIMDSRTQPATVGPRMTVRDAAKLMKENRTTAVCVMEGGTNTSGGPAQAPPKIAGIFTSKDVVLRVIAAGLDPARCSVVRVMTPHPDTAPPTMTIHDALKKMHGTYDFGFSQKESLFIRLYCCSWTLPKLARGGGRRSPGRHRGRAQTYICDTRAGERNKRGAPFLALTSASDERSRD